jgi:3-dehydroquinate dehydratase/shikimate dehydrogenase
MSPKSIGNICVAIGETQPSKIEDALLNTRCRADYLELRLDFLEEPRLCLSTFQNWRRLTEIPLIVTLRRKANGGVFTGTEAEQIMVLERAVEADVSFVDIEIETIENFLHGQLSSLRRKKTQFIASYHNFQETPADLDGICQRLRKVRPDVLKIATFARSFADNFRLLDVVEKTKQGDTPIIAVAMGELGVYSRIVAPSRGALLTYGSLSSGQETAPGQLSARDLKDIYSIQEMNAETQIYGVIGYPVGHSLSPHIHNPAFRSKGLNSRYLPFPLKDLGDFGSHLRRFAGFSVTIPHKVRILDYIDEVDASVKAAGAANTLVRQGNQIRAYNTDVDGIRYALRNALKERDLRVTLLGAGGAARSAALVLKESKCQVTVLARNRAKARLFAEEFGFAYDSLSESFRHRGDLLINSTPVGMFPRIAEIPLPEDSIDYRYVFDMVYNPIETRLMREARSKAKVISGVEMFVAQAARQFELWTGLEAPRALMEAIVVERLSAVQ